MVNAAQGGVQGRREGFTPGPWRVEVAPNGDVGVFADNYGLICYPQEDCYAANARLIAAAPELYELLGAMLDLSSALDPCTSESCSGACIYHEASALLARVQGEG